MFTYTVTLHTLLATHLASFTLLFTEFPYGNPLLGNQNLKQSWRKQCGRAICPWATQGYNITFAWKKLISSSDCHFILLFYIMFLYGRFCYMYVKCCLKKKKEFKKTIISHTRKAGQISFCVYIHICIRTLPLKSTEVCMRDHMHVTARRFFIINYTYKQFRDAWRITRIRWNRWKE